MEVLRSAVENLLTPSFWGSRDPFTLSREKRSHVGGFTYDSSSLLVECGLNDNSIVVVTRPNAIIRDWYTYENTRCLGTTRGKAATGHQMRNRTSFIARRFGMEERCCCQPCDSLQYHREEVEDHSCWITRASPVPSGRRNKEKIAQFINPEKAPASKNVHSHFKEELDYPDFNDTTDTARNSKVQESCFSKSDVPGLEFSKCYSVSKQFQQNSHLQAQNDSTSKPSKGYYPSERMGMSPSENDVLSPLKDELYPLLKSSIMKRGTKKIIDEDSEIDVTASGEAANKDAAGHTSVDNGSGSGTTSYDSLSSDTGFDSSSDKDDVSCSGATMYKCVSSDPGGYDSGLDDMAIDCGLGEYVVKNHKTSRTIKMRVLLPNETGPTPVRPECLFDSNQSLKKRQGDLSGSEIKVALEEAVTGARNVPFPHGNVVEGDEEGKVANTRNLSSRKARGSLDDSNDVCRDSHKDRYYSTGYSNTGEQATRCTSVADCRVTLKGKRWKSGGTVLVGSRESLRAAYYQEVIQDLTTTWHCPPDPYYRTPQAKPVLPSQAEAKSSKFNNAREIIKEQGLNAYLGRHSPESLLSKAEEMAFEWMRFKSFDTYTGQGSASRLAKNGFYQAAENSSTTKCFSCNLFVTDWGFLDDITNVHKDRSPNCSWLQGQDSANVPIKHGQPTQCPDDQRSSASPKYVGQLSVKNEAAWDSSLTSQHAQGGEYTEPQTQCGEAHISKQNQSSHTLVACPVVLQKSSLNTNGHTLIHSPIQPVEEEKRGSPGLIIPTISSIFRCHQLAPGPHEARDELGAEAMPPTSIWAERVSQRCSAVKHPEYSSLNTRIISFQNWPSHLTQTPRQLAEAGLFYGGTADHARCFCCGGGLRNWEAGDDPILEHIRWYPTCSYLLLLKGDGFVRNISEQCRTNREQQLLSSRPRSQRTSSRQRQSNQRAPPPESEEPEEGETTTLLEMGYTVDHVRDVVIELRRITGRMELTAEEVLNYILEQEDQGITQPPPGRPQIVRVEQAPQPQNMSAGPNRTVHQNGSNSGNTSSAAARRPSASPKRKSSQTKSANQKTGAPTSSGSSSGGAKGQNVKRGGLKGGKKPEKSEEGAAPPVGGLKGGQKQEKSEERTIGHVEPRRLMEENKKLRESQLCKICLDKSVAVTFLPCGHLVSCEKCGKLLKSCPICRERIKGTVKTYMS